MKLKTFKTKCVGQDGTEYEFRGMASDSSAAMRAAEHCLMEGRHVAAKAVSCEEVAAAGA